MQNVVEMLAVQANPGAIIPCVRIFRGLYVGSKDFRVPFMLEMKFTYRSRGEQRTAQSSATLASVTVEREIDPKNLDVHPPDVAIPSAVDPGSTMDTSIRVYVSTPAGARVEVGDTHNASFVVP